MTDVRIETLRNEIATIMAAAKEMANAVDEPQQDRREIFARIADKAQAAEKNALALAAEIAPQMPADWLFDFGTRLAGVMALITLRQADSDEAQDRRKALSCDIARLIALEKLPQAKPVSPKATQEEVRLALLTLLQSNEYERDRTILSDVDGSGASTSILHLKRKYGPSALAKRLSETLGKSVTTGQVKRAEKNTNVQRLIASFKGQQDGGFEPCR